MMGLGHSAPKASSTSQSTRMSPVTAPHHHQQTFTEWKTRGSNFGINIFSFILISNIVLNDVLHTLFDLFLHLGRLLLSLIAPLSDSIIHFAQSLAPPQTVQQ